MLNTNPPKLGRGIAWTQRWFAKPVDTGSIPATASIINPKYNMPFFGRGHRFQLGQSFALWLSKGSAKSAFWAGVSLGVKFDHPKRFPADYEKEELVKLTMQKHRLLSAALTELNNLKEKHKNTSIELSKFKREKGRINA